MPAPKKHKLHASITRRQYTALVTSFESTLLGWQRRRMAPSRIKATQVLRKALGESKISSDNVTKPVLTLTPEVAKVKMTLTTGETKRVYEVELHIRESRVQ